MPGATGALARRASLPAVPLAAGLFALVLLGLALPATLAEFALLVGDPARARVAAGEPLTPAGEQRLEWSRRQAIALADRASARLDLGLLELARMRAAARRGDAAASAHAARAVGLLERGLARLPADAEGWSALALARLALRDRHGAAAALRQSWAVAPYLDSLAPARSRLAVLLYEELAADARHLAAREIARLPAAGRHALADHARATGRARQLRALLAAVPAAQPAGWLRAKSR